jgi:P27 family predicted phage terminase small subunit
MAGRPPIPTAIKEARGEAGHRTKAEKARRKSEPQPTSGAPSMPLWLSPQARTVWDAKVEELVEIGVVTTVDGEVFGAYCAAAADVGYLERRIRRLGRFFINDKGNPCARPECALLQQAYQRLDKFALQLGIGAANRTKVSIKPKGEAKNPLADVLKMTDRRPGKAS